MSTWTQDITMRYLNEIPLPAAFTWPHRDGGERAVQPSHSMVIGYGKWLRETPYFPGLFELCHDLLEAGSTLEESKWAERFGAPDALAGQLRKLREDAALPDHNSGRESLAHRLRPLIWTRNQQEFPIIP